MHGAPGGLRARRSGALLLALLLGAAAWLPCGAARAQQPPAPDCDRWFPDLLCEREARFAGFAPPLAAPYLFEDPFITTGVHAHAVWNQFPGRSVFRGGDVRVAAVQMRLALTDRLALIATKDGWVDLRPDLNLVNDETGFMDFGFGVKYALFRSAEGGFIFTPSLRYEATQGSGDVFSGRGAGTWIVAASAGWAVGGDAHLLAGVSAQLPIDGHAKSRVLSYHAQLDHPLGADFTGVIGLNGLHYLDGGRGTARVELASGARLPLSAVQNALGTGRFEGNDVLNLGSQGVTGNDVISAVIGLQRRLGRHLTLGLHYERPLTRRKDLLQHRVHLSALFEY